MKRFFLFFIAFIFSFYYVLAYDASIVTESPVIIKKPEISQAFYDHLNGVPRIYRISEEKEFDLSMKILAPSNTTTTFSGYISRIDNGLETLVGTLDGELASWNTVYEPFSADWYRNGPEFTTRLPAGTYMLSVFNQKNEGAYVLSVGTKESFSFGSVVRTITLLPKIKSDFLGTSHFTLFISPFGILFVIGVGILLTLLWFILFFVIKRYVVLAYETKVRFLENMGKKDQKIRFLFGLLVFVIGIGIWNVGIMVFGAFFLYEAFSKWSGFYALFEKNTKKKEKNEEV